jgi:hypothetical protein
MSVVLSIFSYLIAFATFFPIIFIYVSGLRRRALMECVADIIFSSAICPPNEA